MAENTEIGAAEAAATLAAADLAAQNHARNGTLAEIPTIDPARESQLEDAFSQAAANATEDGKGPKPDTSSADEAAARAEVEAAKAAAAAAAEPTNKTDTTKPKGALDDLLAPTPDKPAANETSDPADEIKLRSDASPKTRETFEQLKTVYKGRLDAATARTAELEAKLKELETKVSSTPAVTPEVEAELKELRAHRAQFDTENDPTFKSKFDTRIGSNYESIYSKLKEHQLPEEEVVALRGMSAKDRDAKIDEYLGKLSGAPASRRFIEAKLLDNTNVQDQRRQELEAVKANAETFLKQRAEAPQQSRIQQVEKIGVLLKPTLASLEWMHEKPIPATATPEQKKVLETANQFALYTQGLLRTAVLDDSPESRANAALALPLAHHFKRELDRVSADYAVVKKELDAIKAAGRTSRTTNSIATPGTGKPAPRPPAENGSEALDSIFADVTAPRSL